VWWDCNLERTIIWQSRSIRRSSWRVSKRCCDARQKASETPVRTFQFGDVQVNFESGEVNKRGTSISLAGKELQLLRYLIDQRGNVVSREELLQNVWEYQSDVSSRTIDVHIAWLRQKLEDYPQSPKFIHTIRGKGCRFST
jgi:DNA-binding response OmpR family regulator